MMMGIMTRKEMVAEIMMKKGVVMCLDILLYHLYQTVNEFLSCEIFCQLIYMNRVILKTIPTLRGRSEALLVFYMEAQIFLLRRSAKLHVKSLGETTIQPI